MRYMLIFVQADLLRTAAISGLGTPPLGNNTLGDIHLGNIPVQLLCLVQLDCLHLLDSAQLAALHVG